MSSFRFGKNDCGNMPVPISAKLLRQNDNIPGSAAQKLCLFRLLPFRIGEYVPDGTEVWELYLLCRELVEICIAPVIRKNWLPYLQQLVIDHNYLFSQYSDSFPCKFHYICHYHRLISEFGPVRNMWCMRFEAKHQYFKRIADVLHNFRNVALSLAARHQFLQCWQFQAESLGREGTVMDTTEIDLHSLPSELQRTLLDTVIGNDLGISLWKTKSVTIDGMTYGENDVVIINVVEEEEIPIFAKVKYLLRCNSTWYVCTKFFKTIRFCKHFHAFEVTGTDQWHIFRAKATADFQCLDVYEVDGRCMITLKYRVCKL
ncbi:hypothetical protein GJAV_G00059800 [Gymnothorax javanicus]|nr:hypothetical protein GJAV_G00059800 [Gymnothorax javanicus]